MAIKVKEENMKKIMILGIGLMVSMLMLVIMTPSVPAQIRKGRIPNLEEWVKVKNAWDDPRPLYQNEGDPKNFLPPEIYKKVTFDVETMKRAWSEVVGLKAPDEVGKIAPEIKSGIYGYKDREKYQFKELMIPIQYNQFKPGGPPHIGNFPEIKIVPTRQYYWNLPIAEATKKNEGKTKLDDKGYLIASSYQAGYPFPRPSGKLKAQQIMYNHVKRYLDGENLSLLNRTVGYDKRLSKDWDSTIIGWQIKANGRVIFEPYGWYDERAHKRGEQRFWSMVYLTPQDSAGNAISFNYYDDVNKPNQSLLYFNQTRRVRKLSAEDNQDPFPGSDYCMDDSYGFEQKLTPSRFPYKFEVIAEREYLVPSYTLDGSSYYTSKGGIELRNLEFERRPVYVLQLTQLDPNYIYKKRILYVDKETFLILFTEMYDQKGRLYRNQYLAYTFYPEQGMFSWNRVSAADHVDLHSMFAEIWIDPFAYWVNRDYTGIGGLMKTGK
jgi:hypothetical protein